MAVRPLRELRETTRTEHSIACVLQELHMAHLRRALIRVLPFANVDGPYSDASTTPITNERAAPDPKDRKHNLG